jgi:hypothetical protein
MAEQVAFTIIDQAIRYNRLEEYKKVILWFVYKIVK